MSVYNNIDEILGDINTYITISNFGGPDRFYTPLNFRAMPAGLSVEVIAKVPSRHYPVPRYFFTVYLPWRTIGGTVQHYKVILRSGADLESDCATTQNLHYCSNVDLYTKNTLPERVDEAWFDEVKRFGHTDVPPALNFSFAKTFLLRAGDLEPLRLAKRTQNDQQKQL